MPREKGDDEKLLDLIKDNLLPILVISIGLIASNFLLADVATLLVALFILGLFLLVFFLGGIIAGIILKSQNETVEKMHNVLDRTGKINTELKQSLEEINYIVKDKDLSSCIMDSGQLIDLEGSVGICKNNQEIYIISSLFTLEKGPLRNTIIWNLRKGVSYKYLIPNQQASIAEYKKMIKDWYESFSSFLNNKNSCEEAKNKYKDKCDDDWSEKYGEYWCKAYDNLIDEALKLWKKPSVNKKELDALKDKCKNMFLKQIKTYASHPDHFYVTVAIYEVNGTCKDAIIKLPSENPNEKYYAFKIPDKNKQEKDTFIENVCNLYESVIILTKDDLE